MQPPPAMSEHFASVVSRGFAIVLVATCCVLVSTRCGYRPVYATAGSERYCVVGASPTVADVQASAALETGVKSELAKMGVVGDCSRAHRVSVSLLELRTTSEGIVDLQSTPVSRGLRVTAVASATIDADSPEARQQGPVEYEVLLAPQQIAFAESQSEQSARVAAARGAGERLARRIAEQGTAASVHR